MKNKAITKIILSLICYSLFSCNGSKLNPSCEDLQISENFNGNQKRFEMKIYKEILGTPEKDIITLRKIDKEKRIESLLVAIKEEEKPEILVTLEKTGEDNYENFVFYNKETGKEFIGILGVLKYFLIENNLKNNIVKLQIFCNNLSTIYLKLSIYDYLPKVIDLLKVITKL